MTPEQMDEPQPVTGELRRTLRELEFMNRYLGGHRYVRRFLRRHFNERGRTYRIIDLGTGGGDFPRAMVDWARKSGRSLVVDAVDSGAAIVELGKRFSRDYPEIAWAEGDALTFAAAGGYDLVHCSLSLHHFESADAVRLLKNMHSLASGHVLITDLVHGWATTWGVAVVNRLLGHNEMTVKDGDTSARRAYSFADVEELAQSAGWRSYRHERFPICRQALWLKVGETAA